MDRRSEIVESESLDILPLPAILRQSGCTRNSFSKKIQSPRVAARGPGLRPAVQPDIRQVVHYRNHRQTGAFGAIPTAPCDAHIGKHGGSKTPVDAAFLSRYLLKGKTRAYKNDAVWQVALCARPAPHARRDLMIIRPILLLIAVAAFVGTWAGDHPGRQATGRSGGTIALRSQALPRLRANGLRTATGSMRNSSRTQPADASAALPESGNRRAQALPASERETTYGALAFRPDCFPQFACRQKQPFAGATPEIALQARVPRSEIAVEVLPAPPGRNDGLIAAESRAQSADRSRIALPLDAEPDGFGLIARLQAVGPRAAEITSVAREAQAVEQPSAATAQTAASKATASDAGSEEFFLDAITVVAGRDVPLPDDIALGKYRVIDEKGTEHTVELTTADFDRHRHPVRSRDSYVVKHDGAVWRYIRIYSNGTLATVSGTDSMADNAAPKKGSVPAAGLSPRISGDAKRGRTLR
jgi:hypothetical protein